MIISEIHINNYRSLEGISVQFPEKINWIIGANGAGKTNLLDAVYYLSFCKSSMAQNDAQNICRGTDYFSVKGNFGHHDLKETVFCAYNQRKQKTVKVDDVAYPRLAEHIGRFPMVLVSPLDMELIMGGAEDRRRFLDVCISQINNNYLRCLMQYNAVLEQRNKCLKQQVVDEILIESYNEQLAATASFIYQQRAATVTTLLPLFQEFYGQISDNDVVSIQYQSQLHDRSMLDLLTRSFERDCVLQYTSCGPHRDDLTISIHSVGAKYNGSQGQKKSLTLALRMAQYAITRTAKQFAPIFLLDDLFDKLDSQRAANLVQLLTGDDFGQVVITDTDRSHSHILKQKSAIIYLTNSKLT